MPLDAGVPGLPKQLNDKTLRPGRASLAPYKGTVREGTEREGTERSGEIGRALTL